MMDLEFTHGLNETISKMIADRWMPAKSAADTVTTPYDSLVFSLNNQVWFCYITLLILIYYRQTVFIVS